MHTYTHTQSVNVQVQFSPRLDLAEIREEALRLSREELVRQAEEAARLEKERLELEQQLAAVSQDSATRQLHAQGIINLFVGY